MTAVVVATVVAVVATVVAVAAVVVVVAWNVIAWVAWWLWAVDWRKTWAVLAQGAWAPVVLLMLISALVWASLAPAPLTGLGFVVIPNFWWQLLAVWGVVAATCFCGWLQGVLQYHPPEVRVELGEPPGSWVHLAWECTRGWRRALAGTRTRSP